MAETFRQERKNDSKSTDLLPGPGDLYSKEVLWFGEVEAI